MKYFEFQQAGKSFNQSLEKSKNFRMPDILEKLISYYNLNEIGSNYAKVCFF